MVLIRCGALVKLWVVLQDTYVHFSALLIIKLQVFFSYLLRERFHKYQVSQIMSVYFATIGGAGTRAMTEAGEVLE